MLFPFGTSSVAVMEQIAVIRALLHVICVSIISSEFSGRGSARLNLQAAVITTATALPDLGTFELSYISALACTVYTGILVVHDA
jgi:hypothetical protein